LLSIALAAFFGAPVAARADDAYLFGYVDALLDDRFPGLGLRMTAIDAQGRASLSSDTCLGPWQRRDIARLLQETGRVSGIVWDRATDCAAEAQQVAPVPRATINIRALPEQALFAPLIADPRQPSFSMRYQRYDTPNQTFNAASVSFGEYFGLAANSFGKAGGAQVGIQGAVFALFNLDATSHDLINADYWIAIPWSFRRGPWSYLVRVYHQSSHLGDEFILGNPGVNRVNLSYEGVEALASHEWEKWRLYGGGGYIFHSEPNLQPAYVHGGVEFVQPRAVAGLDFVAGVDLRAQEELAWRRSRSYAAGFEFRNQSTRRLRLMLEYYRGQSPNGQFYQERLRYWGLGLYFGF
jgi:hypothetical protein